MESPQLLPRHPLVALLWFLLAWGALAPDASAEKLRFPLRSKELTLAIYRPAGQVRGTIVMGSGDAGWVGLAAKMSDFLVQEGYLVVGFNVREYLSAFTSGSAHVTPEDARADYRALSELLTRQGLLIRPVLLSGVSEGAALAVLAAGDPNNRPWVDGVVTMGLPKTAELAWHWYDMAALLTRSDANEPSFSPADYVGAVSPIPLVMIQSATDEYATDADRARLLASARPPRKMVMIGAANHRFTDKLPALREEFLSAIAWIRATPSSPRPR